MFLVRLVSKQPEVLITLYGNLFKISYKTEVLKLISIQAFHIEKSLIEVIVAQFLL